MVRLDRLYRPITADPFCAGGDCREVLPCQALRPYVRCFWGTDSDGPPDGRGRPAGTLVIPDTCMDIILWFNDSLGCVDDRFCGVDTRTFFSKNREHAADETVFAVRFYTWSAILFADEGMDGVADSFFESRAYFGDLIRQLRDMAAGTRDLAQRIDLAQRLLLARLDLRRENPIVMNAVYEMLRCKGNVTVDALAAGCVTGRRQLERLFRTHTGLSPKQLCSLVRYQYLWQELAFSDRFCVHDAVEAYGFCDQAHLLRSFKQHHTLTPAQARQYALHKE